MIQCFLSCVSQRFVTKTNCGRVECHRSSLAVRYKSNPRLQEGPHHNYILKTTLHVKMSTVSLHNTQYAIKMVMHVANLFNVFI